MNDWKNYWKNCRRKVRLGTVTSPTETPHGLELGRSANPAREREREIESLRGDMGSPKDYDEVYARLSKHVTPEKSVSFRSIGPFSHKPTTPGRSASRKRCQAHSAKFRFPDSPHTPPPTCVVGVRACPPGRRATVSASKSRDLFRTNTLLSCAPRPAEARAT